ncbi:two-component system sensor histidine kinase NtrB [Halalkalibacterium ligniniphilum]|uniref:two-component system sensor histidine kinase NtrB n=1 Tax=Halalkalibacterium ligniniphilum TaxID=1134413 RepID=UPI00034A3415|nr:ATP-binding protein [Halalkalibacterium ligniniphilum]
MIERNLNELRKPETSGSYNGYAHFQLNDSTKRTNRTMLKQRNEVEDLFFQGLQLPILKINCQKKIEDWNDEFVELLGIPEDLLKYQSLEGQEIRWPILEKTRLLLNRTLVEGKLIEEEFEYDETFIRIRAFPPIKDGSVYIVYFDQSIQKQLEHLMTFHHQMEAVSHIAAGVAHELRNPLSVIKGFLQLAQLTKGLPKYYDTILSELNRMNGIIEDFLSVSRRKIERKVESPERIMKSLIEIIKSECLLHNVTFHIQLHSSERGVYVNESMIKQVMLNLLRNSIEAFQDDDANRMFWIECYEHEDGYYIFIEDNGRGMSEEVLTQLGKPFFTTKEQGTGIGIPLCRKIIEDHGGTFMIGSQVNKGTKVTIVLPYAE